MEAKQEKPTYTHEEGVMLFELDKHYNAVGWPKHYIVYDEAGLDYIDKEILNGSVCYKPMEDTPFAYFYKGKWITPKSNETVNK